MSRVAKGRSGARPAQVTTSRDSGVRKEEAGADGNGGQHTLLREGLRWKREALLAAAVLGAGLLFLLVACNPNLLSTDLHLTFDYNGDSLSAAAGIKGLVEHGWYEENPSVGAPLGGFNYDFPGSDILHWAIIKVLALVTRDYAVTMNVFYLLTYPLTAISALLVLRLLGVSAFPAFALALLYTFLPYHQQRGEAHLFLGAYYMVPWAALILLWVCRGDPDLFVPKRGLRFGVRWKAALPVIILCVLVACSGIYYGLFLAMLLVVAGGLAWARTGQMRRLVTAGALIAVIGATMFVNVVPTLVFQARNGKNEAAIVRSIGNERYGLKIVQLLLPRDGHRVDRLRVDKQMYNAGAPDVNENSTASLGVIGAIGFLLLVGWLLFGRGRGGMMADAAVLNTSAVLLGTIGGFSSALMLTVLPDIRSYNRISVFIGFFALLAIGLAFDGLRARWAGRRVLQAALWGVAGLGLLVGLCDQTSYSPGPSQVTAKEQEDHAYFATVEGQLPNNAMVFELPYVPFPESPPVGAMGDYEQFRPYLQTHHVRWSYGAIKGRTGDAWQRFVSALPTAEMLKQLAAAGFDGVYIDRKGYPDQGAQLEREIAGVLHVSPLVSQDGTMAFYPMAAYRARVAPSARS